VSEPVTFCWMRSDGSRGLTHPASPVVVANVMATMRKWPDASEYTGVEFGMSDGSRIKVRPKGRR
jgi:hypothetical protein